MPRFAVPAATIAGALVMLAIALFLGVGEEEEPDRGEPIVVKTTRDESAKTRVALESCREQLAGKDVPDDVRRDVRMLCEQAAGKSLKDIEATTLAACLLVAGETGDLDACGGAVVKP
jgi:hypothetical protein